MIEKRKAYASIFASKGPLQMAVDQNSYARIDSGLGKHDERRRADLSARAELSAFRTVTVRGNFNRHSGANQNARADDRDKTCHYWLTPSIRTLS
jgi:hypothetical protein